MAKPIAIILLNWNTPYHTCNCISSLLTHGNTSLFDVIVADNGSEDGSLELIRQEYPGIMTIDNKENLGFAEGNNRAIRHAISLGYTYTLLLNNDTEIEDDLISALFGHMEAHPEAGAVQPAIYWLNRRAVIWNGEGRYNALTGKIWSDKNLPGDRHYRKAKWLTGCGMLVRNAAFKKTGLFNARFFLYYEDVELSFRIALEGYELHFLPQLRLYHEAGASGQVPTPGKEGTLSPIIHYYVARNHIWFLRKFGNPVCYPLMAIYHTPYYLGLFLYFLIRGRRKKARFLLNGIKDGFFVPETVIWPKLARRSLKDL